MATLVTITATCRGYSRQDAVDLATALMESEPDAAQYSLDNLRVYSGNSVWSIYFRRQSVVRLPPGVLVTVNKKSGEVRRVPDR